MLGHYMVLGALEFPVFEHNTIFFFSVLRHQCSGTKCEHSLGLCSHSVPEHDSSWALMWTEFGHRAHAWVQGLNLLLGH